MATPPPNAKEITGCMEYGVDQNGAYVFFGFKLKDGTSTHFTTNYLGLGVAVNYLVTIAQEAQQRRLKIDPAAEHIEVRERQSNPVLRVDIDPDVTGHFSLWQCTTKDGTRQEIEIPLDIMEALVAALPPRISEMKKRQENQKRQQH